MNLARMLSQLHKNRFKSDDSKNGNLKCKQLQIAVASQKDLIVASWESIAGGVVVWEHCGISASNGRFLIY